MPMTILATIDPASSRVQATDSRGRTMAMDTSPPIGEDTAPGPKELVLAALAGCGAMDVASLLRKKRQSATAYEVAVSADSAEEHPRVFTAITIEHRVTGDVEPEALRRSVELSSTRYCPVNAMLSATVRVEHWYRLTDAKGGEHHALVAVTGPEGSRVL